MEQKIQSVSAPLMRDDFYQKLERAFPQIIPEPNKTSLELLMFNAGERRVIEWIKVHVYGPRSNAR